MKRQTGLVRGRSRTSRYPAKTFVFWLLPLYKTRRLLNTSSRYFRDNVDVCKRSITHTHTVHSIISSDTGLRKRDALIFLIKAPWLWKIKGVCQIKRSLLNQEYNQNAIGAFPRCVVGSSHFSSNLLRSFYFAKSRTPTAP